jgi:hypothetical protein
MYKIVNVIKNSARQNLKLAVIAFAVACAVVPVSGAMAQSHGTGGAGRVRGGTGGVRGGYGGFRGYGRPGVGFYFGGPFFGWPYYYGFPYGYPYSYGYYYPYSDYYPYPYPDEAYPYPPQSPPGPAAAAPESNWYYCDDPKGYYPYVASCNKQWREVSPTPVPPPPSASQPSTRQ